MMKKIVSYEEIEKAGNIEDKMARIEAMTRLISSINSRLVIECLNDLDGRLNGLDKRLQKLEG
jgi:hypothetical protein